MQSRRIIEKSCHMRIGGLGNLALINRAVGLVNPPLIQCRRTIRFAIRFAISGLVEKEEIFAFASFVLKRLLWMLEAFPIRQAMLSLFVGL